MNALLAASISTVKQTNIRNKFAGVNLRPGGGSFRPRPLWFFDDNSKTKGSSVTKFSIPFH